jgi:hypothetical protein
MNKILSAFPVPDGPNSVEFVAYIWQTRTAMET